MCSLIIDTDPQNMKRSWVGINWLSNNPAMSYNNDMKTTLWCISLVYNPRHKWEIIDYWLSISKDHPVEGICSLAWVQFVLWVQREFSDVQSIFKTLEQDSNAVLLP